MKREPTYALEDARCVCGGRILRQVTPSVITGGGNPMFRCSDCERSGAGMTPPFAAPCEPPVRITTLAQLHAAALDRRAVSVTQWGQARIPAAFLISMQGAVLVHLMKSGMFLYEPRNPRGPKKFPALLRSQPIPQNENPPHVL